MKILAVDLSSVVRKFWEMSIDGKLSDNTPMRASVDYVTRAREGFDRVVLALDVGPSFRKLHCAEYKSKRSDPGEVYRKCVEDVTARLAKDGATFFPNKREMRAVMMAGREPPLAIDEPMFYPEADDVIASLALWYTAERRSAGIDADSALCIVSGDTDLWALVSDAAHIEVCAHNQGDRIIHEADVIERFGGVGTWVTEVKALAGDKSDGYDPFQHHDPAMKGGIGEGKAIALLKKYGQDKQGNYSAAEVVGRAKDEDGMPDGHDRKCLRAARGGGLDVGYACARMLTDLPLDFARILAEPKIEQLVVNQVAPVAAELMPSTPAGISSKAGSGGALVKPSGRTLRPYAMQPRAVSEAIEAAKIIFDSRMFPQYPNWESIFVSMALGNEQGVPMATALDQGYVVHGRLARTAAYLVGIVKKSGRCKLLTVLSVSDTACTGAYRSADDLIGPHVKQTSQGPIVEPCPRPVNGACECPHIWTFTFDMAVKAGWTHSKPGKDAKKWITEPQTMLPWAWYRMSCRRGWPELTSGVVTRAELLRDPETINDEAAELLAGETSL